MPDASVTNNGVDFPKKKIPTIFRISAIFPGMMNPHPRPAHELFFFFFRAPLTTEGQWHMVELYKSPTSPSIPQYSKCELYSGFSKCELYSGTEFVFEKISTYQLVRTAYLVPLVRTAYLVPLRKLQSGYPCAFIRAKRVSNLHVGLAI